MGPSRQPFPHIAPPPPLSPRVTAFHHQIVGIPNRLRSRSMDHQSIGTGSPVPAHLPRSVPVSPVTGKPFVPVPPFSSGLGVEVPLPHPPEPSERQRAMEAAVASERKRAKELEVEEAHMTADELRTVLKTERRRTAKILADLAAFRLAAVELQLEAEVIEEGRINGLMRRLDYLQQEKGRIIFDLEREEEMLTNSLQKQLNEVRKEKALLQQQIDREKKSNSSMENHLSDLKERNLATMSQVPEEENEEEEEDNEEEADMGEVKEKEGD
ncbi:hypothetical protein ACA910_021086 [Epithemia clementina (nom. ined.)]